MNTIKSKPFTDETTYIFYTYDKNGRDVKVPIHAQDEETAWKKFDRVYGVGTPVDKVTEKR